MLAEPSPTERLARAIVRYGLYPFSWLVVLLGFHLIWTTDLEPRLIWGASSGFLVLLYLLIEWRLPLERRWMMTWRSLLADLRYAVLNSVTIAAAAAALGLVAISLAGRENGPASHWPFAVQLLVCLLVVEGVNYTLHRAMHRLPGRFGARLWSIHAAHHLPPRLYVMMHAVFHPLNGVLIQTCAIILPVWVMGYDPRIVTMFLMINGMHGAISHFNVDIRAGWANYLFIGPELHRYHHSANPAEVGNFGATLALYDWLFGTAVYRPGQAPTELGVPIDAGLPPYEQTIAVLALPFKA
jgi:sterol desaturase/sphingolipid hydroxylase (fatty acid hydroxylase superfamily)